MATEGTIEAIRCYMAGFNANKLEEPETLNLVTEDVYWVDPRFPAFQGKASFSRYLQYAARENRTIRPIWEAKNIFLEGEQACVEGYAELTLGTKIALDGVSIFRVRDGKIYYYRGYWDTFLWKSRVGFLLSDSLITFLNRMGVGVPKA